MRISTVGGLVGVGSAGVALVGGGLAGGVIIKPKTTTGGWMPAIAGEITLVDGGLVAGALVGDIGGGTGIITPAMGGRSGGGGNRCGDLGDHGRSP